MPTQLSIKRGSWRVLAPVMPELEDLPEQELVTRRVKLAACGPDAWNQPPATVGALVLPRWAPGQPASLARLSPFDALAALVADRIWVGWPMTEARVQGLLDWLERVPAWQLCYPDLESAEAHVAEIYQAA